MPKTVCPEFAKLVIHIREFVLVSGVIDTVVALKSLYKKSGIIIITIFNYSVR